MGRQWVVLVSWISFLHRPSQVYRTAALAPVHWLRMPAMLQVMLLPPRLSCARITCCCCNLHCLYGRYRVAACPGRHGQHLDDLLGGDAQVPLALH